MYTETLSISFKGMGYQQVAEWVYIINLDCVLTYIELDVHNMEGCNVG